MSDSHGFATLFHRHPALLDRQRPEHCLLGGESWLFGPEAPYEQQGDVGNVVFPCGTTIGDDGDTVLMYYGAADTSIGVARGSVRALLNWLDQNGTEECAVPEDQIPVTNRP